MRKAIIFGIVFGVGLAFAALFSISKLTNKIIYEVDDSHALGMRFAPLPEVALSPLTWIELAKVLGYSDSATLRDEGKVFSERISGGYLPSGWDKDCAHKYNSKLCEVLADYFGEHKRVFSGRKRKNSSGVRMEIKNIARLQGDDFNYLVSKIPDWPFAKFKSFAVAALKTESCPHSFSLALAHKVEIHFATQPQAFDLYEQLTKHGLSCVQPEDPWSEFTFLRAGLYEFAKDRFELSVEYLQKATSSVDRREDFRTLFWLVRALEKTGKIAEAGKYRSILNEKHPIAWHTVYSKTLVNNDPMEVFRLRPVYPDQYETKNELVQLRANWLQVLFELEKQSQSIKRYGEFFVRDLPNDLEPGYAQYLARSFDRNAYHRLQIFALNKIFFGQPEKLSRESLRLLFPKPFFDEIGSKSGELDAGVLLGLARQESGFDPMSQSPADARGLLQILPSTAKTIDRRISKEDLFDYSSNIEIGAKFLLKMINQFDGSVEKALAAYNAGGGNVRKWEQRYAFIKDPQLFLDFIPFRETREYVPSILRNAFWYHLLFPEVRAQLKPGIVSSELLKSALAASRPYAEQTN